MLFASLHMGQLVYKHNYDLSGFWLDNGQKRKIGLLYDMTAVGCIQIG